MRNIPCVFSAVLIIILSSYGCSKKVNTSVLPGLYIANHDNGIDKITINSDGTYIHYYKTQSGEEYIDRNVWNFSYEGGEPRITFRQFVFRLPNHNANIPGIDYSTPAFWDVEVEVSFFGNIRLCIDPDLGYYYIKQK